MRSFLRYLLLFLFLLAALTALIPVRYGIPYPSQPGPKFDNAVRSRHTLLMNENNVQLVLVGDSALEKGVDPRLLSASINMPAYAISIPGSTSPFWYVAIKNLILETEVKPKYVVIFFRDTILTVPNYHVNGGYVKEIDEYATSQEDTLLELAYLNFLNPLEKAALTWLPVYGSREQLTGTVDFYARNMLPGLFGTCQRECLERAHAIVYQVDNMQKDLRADVLVNEQDILYTRHAMDFKASVGSSFLPEIIQLTRENGLQLILVHERTLLFSSQAAEPEGLAGYKRALAEYLKANDVILLDFSYDPRIPPDFFDDAIHMTEAGQAAFTQMLAEALIPILR